MEKCYEYFCCMQEDCPAYKAPDNIDCWELEGTLCNSHGIEMIASKLGGKEYACEYCIYFRNVVSKKINL